ncbi:retropepsin-like aspartic protease family protein [Govanella unica]|uniref:TIGR02281 family clan AA aspartic protease n=1 Tax=Govanella unica TaxID=2975056 RepID=A0A9X3Z613_9PROT|nr:TIGR02281 family clan AA aspartic protease [Govania unica]MDA5192543.1 TIGR02281 family clan AA aspartic protease [Govania unica]
MSIKGHLQGLGLLACALIIAAGVLSNRDRAPEHQGAVDLAPGPRDELTLRRDADGHFRVEAEVNGRPLQFLIDTGASHVVLSPADAARIGLRPTRDDFSLSLTTANGSLRAAPVTLDTVRIGSLDIPQVTAVVTGTDLPQSLLGMSFLNRLGRWRVEGDRLMLGD